MMARATETEQRGPWTIDRAVEAIDYLHPIDASELLRSLRSKTRELTTALRVALPDSDEKAKVRAAALLLLLQDKEGREPFVSALRGSDGELRDLAIEFVKYCVTPHDLERPLFMRTGCPIESDVLFEALARDLCEPWTGRRLCVLEIVTQQDYPQARAVTRRLLTHADDLAIRAMIARSYLRVGRDEGAFAVADEMLRSAPPYVPHRDPRWHDFYHVKGFWHHLDMAVENGDAELRNKAAALAMEFLADALDAPDRAQRFDTNDGLVDPLSVAKILTTVMPRGSKELLERLINCSAIDEFYRGEALVSYAQALGGNARPFVTAALQNTALRKYAALATKRLEKASVTSPDVAALTEALSNEERPDAVAALAKALLDAGPDGLAAVEAALERAEPWTRVELAWRIHGGTDREFANLLTEAGVMDPITDEQLAEALSKGFDVQSVIWAGGERLAMFNVKASTGLEHFDLFQALLKTARPEIVVDDLEETIKADVLREPVPGLRQVEQVTDLGTISTVRFHYLGKAYSFDAHPQGRWHDVPAVMKGFDNFMEAIGREDRCYELEGGGEWGLFVVAPASKFEPIAARLRIPLERDSEDARDAAKAYQRQIQNMRPND